MHPVLFRIGNFPIGTYGLAIVIGMLAGLWLTGRLARRRGMPVEFFYDLIFMLLLTGFGGGKLLYIIQNWREFLADPAGMIFARQGFVFQGGFIAALITMVVFARRRGLPFFGIADVMAPGLALAHGFGRIGCFFAGCCYGKACPPESSGTLARLLSVRYPGPDQAAGFDFAYQSQLAAGLIHEGAHTTLPLLPVQLFETFGNFAICAILLWAWRRQRFSGQMCALYMMLYGMLRFGLEFLRGDVERHFYGGLPTGQWLALATLACAAAIWATRRGKGLEPAPVVSGDVKADATVEKAAPAPAARKRKASARRGR